MVVLQPCDWIEHDTYGKYVVDVYGRTEDFAGMVRIEGFKPYLYVVPGDKTIAELKSRLQSEKIQNTIVTAHQKFDAYAGFNKYASTLVWKIEVESLQGFRNASRICKQMFDRVYETNLPPFLRLFHECEIGPASPIAFQPSRRINKNSWATSVKDVKGDPSKTIPLKVAAYDIECMSKTGAFPQATKPWSYIVEHFF